MAMHVVLGDGDMSTKELTKTLEDLRQKALDKDETFWFLLIGKSAPTDTEVALVKWLHNEAIYYEVVTDDTDAMADIYSAAQETHVAKRLGQKIVSLLNTKPEENETADVLALFTSDDPEAAADRWLNVILQSTSEAGFPAFALNDGLVEVDFSEAAAESAAEAPIPAKAAAAPSKAAAKKAAATPAAPKVHTREQLSEMDLGELKTIASAKGIELPPRTRMATYIDAILGEGKEAPSVEITEPPITSTLSTNGDIDLSKVAEEAAAIVIERIVSALQS